MCRFFEEHVCNVVWVDTRYFMLISSFRKDRSRGKKEEGGGQLNKSKIKDEKRSKNKVRMNGIKKVKEDEDT